MGVSYERENDMKVRITGYDHDMNVTTSRIVLADTPGDALIEYTGSQFINTTDNGCAVGYSPRRRYTAIPHDSN